MEEIDHLLHCRYANFSDDPRNSVNAEPLHQSEILHKLEYGVSESPVGYHLKERCMAIQSRIRPPRILVSGKLLRQDGFGFL